MLRYLKTPVPQGGGLTEEDLRLIRHQVVISNLTISTSSTTGALIVTGGVGIGGNLNVDQNFTADTFTVISGNVLNDLIVGGNILSGSITNIGTITSYKGNIDIINAIDVNATTGDFYNITVENDAVIENIYGNYGEIYQLIAPSITNQSFFGGFGVFSTLQVDTIGPTSYSNQLNLGNAANIRISGGYSGSVLSTDGSGNLSWVDGPGSLIYTGGLVKVENTVGLELTGVTPGTYDRVTVDEYGRITTGSVLPSETLQLVTQRGATTNRAITISNAASSTTTTSGALTVAGGVGIAGNLNVDTVKVFSNFDALGQFNVQSQGTFAGKLILNGQNINSVGLQLTPGALANATELGGFEFDGNSLYITTYSGRQLLQTKSPSATSDVVTRVRAIATAPIDISNPSQFISVGGIDVDQWDETILSTGNTVLLTQQADATQNGIYTWNGAGNPLTRTIGYDVVSGMLSGTIIHVAEGLNYGGSMWQVTTLDPITVGSTAITIQETYSKDLAAFSDLPKNNYAGLVTRTDFGTVALRSIRSGNTWIRVDNPDGRSGNITISANTIPVTAGGTGRTSIFGWMKGTGSSISAYSVIPASDISGLGTMAFQNASSVNITGGSISVSSITATTGQITTFTGSSITASSITGTSGLITTFTASSIATTNLTASSIIAGSTTVSGQTQTNTLVVNVSSSLGAFTASSGIISGALTADTLIVNTSATIPTLTGSSLSYVDGSFSNSLYVKNLSVNASISANTITANNITAANTITANNVVVDTISVTGDVSFDNLFANGIPLGANSVGSLNNDAVSVSITDNVTDTIALMNEVLGKLVPPKPPAFPGSSTLSMNSLVSARMTNFIQDDNTVESNKNVAAGTSLTSIRRSTSYTTSTISSVGPGDSGTVRVYKNGTLSGSKAMVGGSNGTFNDLIIANNRDYKNILSNIPAGFWYSFDARASGTTSAGWNEIYIEHTAANQTNTVIWYTDTNSVGAPEFSTPSISLETNVVTYSSTIPHFTTDARFILQFNLAKLSGDTYPTSDNFVTGTAGGAYSTPTTLTYATAGISTPLSKNAYASSTVSLSTYANIKSGFGSSSSGPSLTADNSYSTATQTFTPSQTILYKTGTSNQIEETSIPVNSVGTGSGNALRIVNPGSSDTPAFSASAAAFNSQTSTLNTYDAVVVAAVLKHDQTNYQTNYLPVGPNLSSGRSGAQYFTMKFVRTVVSKFDVKYTGTLAGLWIALPGSDIDTSSTLNGWLDLSVAYNGSGIPGAGTGGNGSNGASVGGTATLNSAVTNKRVTATFGTQSSSTTVTNEIYVRIKLTSGQSLTALTIETASN